MTSLVKARTVGGVSSSAIEGASVSVKVGGVSPQTQGDSEAEGNRLNERVEKRIMDIETGKVKMRRYTLDEHVRYLDDMLGG